jgi:hypothetical protein
LGEVSTRNATGIRPENLVWIFGTARTGSTWLSSMMGEVEGQTVWFEPFVGEFLGRPYYEWNEEAHFQTKHFILSEEKDLWIEPARTFILQTATRRFSEVGPNGYLIVKEPNGSTGAPLLSETFPESRLILLIRDPRDAVASAVDTWKKGSWYYEASSSKRRSREDIFEAARDEVVEERAKIYLEQVESSRLAYEAHRGYKSLVRYEDLRADTLGTMIRLYSGLAISVQREQLARAVEKYSWGNISDEHKGEGKFHRKAKPGGWKEDLTPEQIETVERITAPVLKEFYT